MYCASRNSPLWPIPARAISLIFIVQWSVITPQFTLIIHWIIDQATESSRELYASFLEKMRQLYDSNKIKGQYQFQLLDEYMLTIADGKFGAMMDVSLTNEVRGIVSAKTCFLSLSLFKGTSDIHSGFTQIWIYRQSCLRIRRSQRAQADKSLSCCPNRHGLQCRIIDVLV